MGQLRPVRRCCGIAEPPRMASRWLRPGWACFTRTALVSRPTRLRLFRCICSAAMQGDAISERVLAVAYRDGIGVQPVSADAAEWMARSADHGDADAMYLLSQMYLRWPGRDEKPRKGLGFSVTGGPGRACAGGGAGGGRIRSRRLRRRTRTRHPLGIGWKSPWTPRTGKPGSIRKPLVRSGRMTFAQARYRLGMILLETDPDRAVELLTKAAIGTAAIASCQLALCIISARR